MEEPGSNPECRNRSLLDCTDMSRSDSEKGRGRSRTVFTRLKMAVVAPMPSAIVRIVVIAKPGDLDTCLIANLTFCKSLTPTLLLDESGKHCCNQTANREPPQVVVRPRRTWFAFLFGPVLEQTALFEFGRCFFDIPFSKATV